MKVLVLGAGVIGVTTAHYLAADGHEVAVIDRQIGPALETSFGNAGNVCPSYATPVGGPGNALRRRSSGSCRTTPRSRVDWHADAAFARWCLAWLAQLLGAPLRAQQDAHAAPVALQPGAACGNCATPPASSTTRRRAASCSFSAPSAELQAVVSHTRILERNGIPHKVLAPKGCVEVEPALAHAQVPFAGGLHLPADETGDC